MPLTPRFNLSDKRNELQMALLRIEQAIVNRLSYLGERCVNVARDGGLYKNRTANLRNSIGYVVFARGEMRVEKFQRTATGDTPSSDDPLEMGRSHAIRKAMEKTGAQDYVLIVVAGMEYASTVEAMGKDVLTTAEQYCEEQLPRMIAQLKANIKSLR